MQKFNTEQHHQDHYNIVTRKTEVCSRLNSELGD